MTLQNMKEVRITLKNLLNWVEALDPSPSRQAIKAGLEDIQVYTNLPGVDIRARELEVSK